MWISKKKYNEKMCAISSTVNEWRDKYYEIHKKYDELCYKIKSDEKISILLESQLKNRKIIFELNNKDDILEGKVDIITNDNTLVKISDNWYNVYSIKYLSFID